MGLKPSSVCLSCVTLGKSFKLLNSCVLKKGKMGSIFVSWCLALENSSAALFSGLYCCHHLWLTPGELEADGEKGLLGAYGGGRSQNMSHLL